MRQPWFVGIVKKKKTFQVHLWKINAPLKKKSKRVHFRVARAKFYIMSGDVQGRPKALLENKEGMVKIPKF